MLVARAVAEGKPIGELLGEAASIEGLPAPAIEGCRQLDELLRLARDRFERQPLADVARDLIQHIRYQDEIDRLHKEPADRMSRWAAVEEVINSLAAYQKRARKPTLGGFLEDVALGGRDDSSDKETQLQRNAIVLMTLHAAKGLEFPHVYLVGLEEGLLPHHRSVAADGPAIDEERRLCYVGVTRARDRLTLSLSLSRMKWGKPRPTIPSRFLFELMGKADNPQAIAALRAAREQIGGSGEGPQPKGKPKGKSAARRKGSRTTKRPGGSSSGKHPRPKGR
jgi:DNA helicase-2/ATP-dependent DNA helicase PcrA